LKDLLKKGHIIGKKGKDKIAIPIPYIDLPRFKHGKPLGPGKEGGGEGEGESGPGFGGVGIGPGNVGDPVGFPQAGEGEIGGEGSDGKKAGEGSSEHPLEVELSLEELVELLKEELQLPNIKPRGKKKNIYSEEDVYKGLRRVGPYSLLRFDKTYLEALKRLIASEEYNYEDPIVIPTKDDMRFLSWRKEKAPIANAVIMYIMDVSGSMSGEHRELARKISFWIDLWIKYHYNEVESVYIIHDTQAWEVDEETFYKTVAGGGTKILSAYLLANKLIEKKYPPEDWNIYVIQYSDGENWGSNEDEINVLDEKILPNVNLFCYGQIDLIPGWVKNYNIKWFFGQFKKDLDKYKEKKNIENLITTSIHGEEDIYDTLKKFLGTGK